jgi:NifU-like protein
LVAAKAALCNLRMFLEVPVSELFFKPQNVGDASEPSFTGRSASFNCGASLRISLQIDESQRIVEAKFKAAGCSVMVAAAELMTGQVRGMNTGEAAALGQQFVLIETQLGQLEMQRTDCARMACDALLKAIQEYSDSVRESWEGDQALICTCFGVSEKTIEREIRVNALRTIAEVTRACNAGAGCRSCYPLIEDILEDCRRVNGKW